MSVSPPQSGPAVPEALFGYEIVDVLGEGGASMIYAATDPKTRQLYALKHVVRRTDKDDRYIDQLENEFAVGKLVIHPALRKSIEFRSNGGGLRRITEAALVLELVYGQNLLELATSPVPVLVKLFVQAAEAILALNEMGYVHCDLKPRNVLVDDDGTVKIIDLGTACLRGTMKKRMQGTEGYMSPEQKLCHPLTFRTDVFSFGATMYHVLTGQKLVMPDPAIHRDIVPPAQEPTPEILQTIPPPLLDLTLQCIRMDPSARLSSIEDVLRRLLSIRANIG